MKIIDLIYSFSLDSPLLNPVNTSFDKRKAKRVKRANRAKRRNISKIQVDLSDEEELLPTVEVEGKE
jgi:hypothetical protein